jgi:hypothetical protein
VRTDLFDTLTCRFRLPIHSAGVQAKITYVGVPGVGGPIQGLSVIGGFSEASTTIEFIVTTPSTWTPGQLPEPVTKAYTGESNQSPTLNI